MNRHLDPIWSLEFCIYCIRFCTLSTYRKNMNREYTSKMITYIYKLVLYNNCPY